MTISAQTLNGHTLEYNPTKMSSPESKKSVSPQETYTGSAIFTFGTYLQGQQVTLEWDGMSETEYQALRTIYLMTGPVVWTLGNSWSYNVVVLSFEGDYIEHQILYDAPFRINCKMVLDIRSTA